MFTVALVGPDGAGKSTITRRVEQELSVPVKYIYMGVNVEASNLMLPTTRLMVGVKRLLGRQPDMGGPPDPERLKRRPKNPVKRAISELKTALRIANLMAEEWFRQIVVCYYLRRGYVVLFDRHFFTDYYAHDIAGAVKDRPLANRLHGWMLKRLYPRPHLIICLDAPAEVLFARKAEGSVELLERRRQEYFQLRDTVKHFVMVDAAQTPDEVTRQVIDLIMDLYKTHSGRPISA